MEMTITGNRDTPSSVRKNREFYRRNAYLANERLISTSRRIELAERGLAILEVLLALRFIFQLFGASYINPFAALDYVVTFPFVLPFYGLFGLNPSSGLLRPQLETLAAMVAWAVIAWMAIGFARMSAKKMDLAQ